MNEKELFERLSDIDDAWILEAHDPVASRSFRPGRSLRRMAAMAAAVALVLTLSMFRAVASDEQIPSVPVESFPTSSSYQAWLDGKTVHREDYWVWEEDGVEHTMSATLEHDPSYAIAHFTTSRDIEIMILLDAVVFTYDGNYECRRVEERGKYRVTAVLNNMLDRMPGTVITTRVWFIELEPQFSVVSGYHTNLRSYYYVMIPDAVKEALKSPDLMPSFTYPSRETREDGE